MKINISIPKLDNFLALVEANVILKKLEAEHPEIPEIKEVRDLIVFAGEAIHLEDITEWNSKSKDSES